MVKHDLKTRSNLCWWRPSTTSPPSTSASTLSPSSSRRSTWRKGLSTVSNSFAQSCTLFRFGFLRFLGIVILSVLGTSVTYILLGRWLENHLKMFKIPTAGWCSRWPAPPRTSPTAPLASQGLSSPSRSSSSATPEQRPDYALQSFWKSGCDPGNRPSALLELIVRGEISK